MRMIESIAFESDGAVQINYATIPGDSRGRGVLTQQHVIRIAPAAAYRDDITELLQAAEGLLDFALGNWSELPPDDPEALAREALHSALQSEVGMGFDPEPGADR